MTEKATVRLSEVREVWESFSGWYWFVTEYHEGTLAFGLVRGWETEWGYFDLAELRQLRKRCLVWRVPRDHWALCPCVEDAVSYSRVATPTLLTHGPAVRSHWRSGRSRTGVQARRQGARMAEGAKVQIGKQRELRESRGGWRWCLVEHHQGSRPLVWSRSESPSGPATFWPSWVRGACVAAKRDLGGPWAASPCVGNGAALCSGVATPGDQELKGGGGQMSEEFDRENTATLIPTRAGNGYKVVVNGRWFYASKQQLHDLITGARRACNFHTIADDLKPAA